MRSLILALMAILLVLPAAPAWADRAAEAKAAYNLGKQHFKAGEYREAMVQLKKSFKLKPHPSLLRYIGDTCYKMNQAREAIKYYRKYLAKAPMAADRDKVEAKVRQLELIVGAGEEDEDFEDDQAGLAPPPPPPPPTRTRTRRSTGTGGQVELRPTGEDAENPLLAADRRRKAGAVGRTSSTRRLKKQDKPSGAIKVAKWLTLSLGVAGLVTGVTFTVLASQKAGDLETAVKTDCPLTNPNCPGNPEMNNPVVAYNAKHHQLMQDHKTYQTVGIAGLVAGGALAVTGIVLFIVDGKSTKKERRRSELGKRVVLAPALSPGFLGLTGEVKF